MAVLLVAIGTGVEFLFSIYAFIDAWNGSSTVAYTISGFGAALVMCALWACGWRELRRVTRLKLPGSESWCFRILMWVVGVQALLQAYYICDSILYQMGLGSIGRLFITGGTERLIALVIGAVGIAFGVLTMIRVNRSLSGILVTRWAVACVAGSGVLAVVAKVVVWSYYYVLEAPEAIESRALIMMLIHSADWLTSMVLKVAWLVVVVLAYQRVRRLLRDHETTVSV